MGFEIFFRRGVNDPCDLPTLDALREELGGASDDPTTGLVLPDELGGCWVLVDVDDPGPVGSFTVDRPALHEALWAALHRLLTRYHYCAFWPAVVPPVIGRSDTTPHPELIETLGEARLAMDPTDLPRWIRES